VIDGYAIDLRPTDQPGQLAVDLTYEPGEG